MKRIIPLGALRIPRAIRSRSVPLDWRRLTIGLGIGGRSLRAVGVSAGSVRWAIEVERQDGESLTEALTNLLMRCPVQKRRRVGWMRPRVMVAIGPSMVQVKKLSRLPLLRDSAALSAVIREGSGRFFLKNGVPLATSDVAVIEPGTGWAAAFEAPVVEQVQRACTDAGLALRAIIPAAVALGQVAQSGELTWTDGNVQAQLAYRDRQVVASRQLRVPRCNGECMETVDMLPHPALQQLGDNASNFADAYGATRIERGELLALSIGGAPRVGTTSHTRTRIAATTFCMSALAALVVPPLLAVRSTTRARERLALIGPEARKASGIERELDQVSSTLQQLSEFAPECGSVTVLLERITAALPEHAALVSLEVDSARGTIVALAPRAAQVTDALERVAGIASPQVVGPITPVTTRARVVERVTIRFWLVPSARTGPADSVGDPGHSPEGAVRRAVNGTATTSSGDSR